MRFQVPARGVSIEEAGTNFAEALKPAMGLAGGPFGISESWIRSHPNLSRALAAIESGDGHVSYDDALLVANSAQDGWAPMLMDAIAKTPRDVAVRITDHPFAYDPLGNEIDLNGYLFTLSGMTVPARGNAAGVVENAPERLTLVGRFEDAIKIAPNVLSAALLAQRAGHVLNALVEEIEELGKDVERGIAEPRDLEAKRNEAKAVAARAADAKDFVMEHRVEASLPEEPQAENLTDEILDEHLINEEQRARDEYKDTSRDRKDQVGPYNFADRSREFSDRGADIDMGNALKGNTALPEEERKEMLVDIAAQDPARPAPAVLKRAAATRDFDVQRSLLKRGLALDALAESEHEQIVSGVASKLGLPRSADKSDVMVAAYDWAKSNPRRTLPAPHAEEALARFIKGSPTASSAFVERACAPGALSAPKLALDGKLIAELPSLLQLDKKEFDTSKKVLDEVYARAEREGIVHTSAVRCDATEHNAIVGVTRKALGLPEDATEKDIYARAFRLPTAHRPEERKHPVREARHTLSEARAAWRDLHSPIKPGRARIEECKEIVGQSLERFSEEALGINYTLAQARAARSELDSGQTIRADRREELEAMVDQFPAALVSKRYPDTKAGNLEKVLDEAKDTLLHAAVSEDGAGIPAGQKWITPAKKASLQQLTSRASAQLTVAKMTDRQRAGLAKRATERASHTVGKAITEARKRPNNPDDKHGAKH